MGGEGGLLMVYFGYVFIALVVVCIFLAVLERG